ncbi:leukocyte elastase inhibitor-like isoform X2 [Cheilinus undulatus]|uniref:leukocyte elastase inhibitor-like isoform X2 n=1 Tax=Cheilinus undulatus TaxID=241271 RepID=UPI001BD52213|nr:leukocyte elastase inhibitor-like isoform X2 [Cheilinus undulatus]
MSPAEELVLSKVVHKAFVKVNETGTEAAAANISSLDELDVMAYSNPLSKVFTFPLDLFRRLYTMAFSSPLTKANTSFCLALFKKLSENDNTANIFFSPFSISSALAMLMLGARGNTAAQMSECLETKECQDEVHTGFTQLLRELNKAGALYALSVANRLYGEKSCQFEEEFLESTKKHYEAELEMVDFITGFEAARLNINNWVEGKTQGKIKDLLAQGVVDSLTRLVLVNAIYFKGKWSEQFEEWMTWPTPFRLTKILEMPYKGKELSMLIFLPNEIEDETTGLEKLEMQLTYENFERWTNMMQEVEVMVKLPRFKMEETYDLMGVLMSMGMVDAFDMGMCDFSGMSPAKELVLSKVVHKAFVEVNETGTEAAAATFFSSYASINLSKPLCFIADHPFVFFIRHNPSKSILFAGRHCSPLPHHDNEFKLWC